MKQSPLNKNNVKLSGNPEGQAMIFGHGFGIDQHSWAAVTPAFEARYKIVLYDNVGGGASDPAAFSPNKYDSLQTYADDLIDICDALQLKDVVMIGHSVSGMISVLAALKRPDLFERLVLVGASPRYLNDDGYTGGFDQSTLNEFYAQMSANYFAWISGFAPLAMANEDRPALAQSFADTLKAIRPDIAQSVAKVIFQSDYRSVIGKLTKPVLIIQSIRDIAVPEAVAHFLHNGIPGSILKIVNAEGHFPHVSAPDEVVNAIKSFI